MEWMKVPQHADDPPQLLIFTVDEFAILMMFMVVGEVFNMLLPGMMLGFAMSKLYRKMQEGMMPGMLLHLLWWIGLARLKGKFWTGLIRELYQL